MGAVDMKRNALMGLATAVSLCTAEPFVYAHHSHPYFYDECRSLTIEGRVERVEFKAPHSVIVLRADDGTAYTVDWAPLWRLTTDRIIGPAKQALVFGARVVLTGNRIRPAAQIQQHFPNFSSDVNPNTVDPTSIRAGDSFSWALEAPPQCAGK